jgi:hypothetical protein
MEQETGAGGVLFGLTNAGEITDDELRAAGFGTVAGQIQKGYPTGRPEDVDEAFLYDKAMNKPFFEEAMTWAQTGASSERRLTAIRHAMQKRWGPDADVTVTEITRPQADTIAGDGIDVIDLLSDSDED